MDGCGRKGGVGWGGGGGDFTANFTRSLLSTEHMRSSVKFQMLRGVLLFCPVVGGVGVVVVVARAFVCSSSAMRVRAIVCVCVCVSLCFV